MGIFEQNPPHVPNPANWTPPNLKVCVVRPGLAALPRYASAAAAGMDLSAALVEPLTLPPGARALIPTGLAIALPHGFEGQVRPRSGLAIKHGVTIVNAPGTIDEDYRGEVSVALINLGKESYTIQPGERIAQLIVAPVLRLAVECVGSVEELGLTQRGAGGFGSTGGFGSGGSGQNGAI